MNGIRIFVFSLKDVIKSALLFITGIIIIIFLIFMFIPKGNEESNNSKYIPGEYSSSFYLNDSLASVIVTVDEYSIVDVRLVPLSESQEVFFPLLEPLMEDLSAQIIETQSTEIETSVESMQTSRVLLTAVDSALEEATIIQ